MTTNNNRDLDLQFDKKIAEIELTEPNLSREAGDDGIAESDTDDIDFKDDSIDNNVELKHDILNDLKALKGNELDPSILSNASLEEKVKERIEETFPPQKRFAVWRVASYVLRAPSLYTDGVQLYLKDEIETKKSVDLMGFLDAVTNRSLHLHKGKEKLDTYRHMYGKYVHAFEQDTNIPENFAPGIPYLRMSPRHKYISKRHRPQNHQKERKKLTDMKTNEMSLLLKSEKMLYPPEQTE